MDKIDFLQSYKKLQNLATDLAPVLDLFFTKICLFLITFLKILRHALSLPALRPLMISFPNFSNIRLVLSVDNSVFHFEKWLYSVLPPGGHPPPKCFQFKLPWSSGYGR